MSLMRIALVAGWTLLLASVSQAGDIEPRERVNEQQTPLPFGDIGPEETIIQHQLDTTDSRVLRHSQRPLEREQLQRDLRATGQRLDSFKTEHPNAAATPLFERHLDRLSRPTRIIQPGPPTLLDQR